MRLQNKSLAEVLTRGMTDFSTKSIGTAESGFLSRWGWSLDSWSGKRVTQDTALQNDTVWACVRLIANAVATLPLGYYERLPDGGRQLAPGESLYDLLHNEPNLRMSAVSYWQAVVASMLLWGNAYSEIDRTGRRITGLNFLNPANIRLGHDSAGYMTYEYVVGSVTRKIPRDRMFHIKAFSLDGETGISAIQYGFNSIGSALAADQASDEIFRDASRASGMVMMDSLLQPAQREQIRAHVKKVGQDGGIYVLEKGASFQSLQFNPQDAELLASRSFSVETICRWFAVPPVMIGHGDKQSSWPTSTEAQGALFLRYVLRPLLSGIEQEIRRALLTTAERLRFFAEFNIEGLLRGDTAARTARYASALQNAEMNRNEVRALENLPPIEGGEIFTIQSNLIPLNMVGKLPPQQTPKEENGLPKRPD